MQRNFTLFLTTVILSGSIYGVLNRPPENEITDGISNYEIGENAVEATEDLEPEEEGTARETEELSVDEIEDSEQEAIGENESEENEVSGNRDEECLENLENDEKEIEEEQKEEIQEPEEQQEGNYIYNVSFPTNSKAYLDPGNLSGKGQIFSDEFKVENYGNTDVVIKIKNIQIYCESTEELYELSEDDITEVRPHVKKIDVDVVWKNENENIEKVMDVVEGEKDEYVLRLKASEYDKEGDFVRLGDGSTGLFYFTGNLNPDPELVWEDSGIKVSFDYEIVMDEEKDMFPELEG